MRTIYDLDNSADAKAAGVVLAALVRSEAWEVVRQVAAYVRERDTTKSASTLEELAALNGRNEGMKALLANIERLADAALKVEATAEPGTVARMVRDLMDAPGTGPV